MIDVLVAACLKWVDLRADIDPLTGAVSEDPRFFGLSLADQAALEWALRLGEAWSAPVLALSAGPAAAESGLREALACGATRALRVPVAADAPSATVAAALATGLGAGGELLAVCCGDRSADRGSGAVPAFLAARLGAVQALGLVTLDVRVPSDPSDGLLAERRLDRGRRERLRLQVPAVVSVDGGSARLRRAGLPGVLAAQRAAIGVGEERAGVGPPLRPHEAPLRPHEAPLRPHEAPPAPMTDGVARDGVRLAHRGAFRPRPRTQPAPDPAAPPRQRILDLVGARSERTPPRTVQAEPEEAAHIILDQLRSWGYLK